MIKPIVKETKVVFGPCRLSYTHLFEKYGFNGDNSKAKFMTNILIPKDEKETIRALEKAIEAAKKEAIVKTWGGKDNKKMESPLHDGDGKDNVGEEYADMFFLNAKTGKRPGIVDRKKVPIVDEEEIYSGVWAIVSVTFYGFDVSGNRGIACSLNNVMKFKDDEPLGGSAASPEKDFEDVDLDDEDDDDL